jgi:ribosome-binding factor A
MGRARGEGDAERSGHRHQRLQQLLHEELAAVVRDELSDPRLDSVIITNVELSVDYKNVKVRFLVPNAKDVSREDRARLERAFERASPFLRGRLADAIDTKATPALRFVFDKDAADAPDIR